LADLHARIFTLRRYTVKSRRQPAQGPDAEGDESIAVLGVGEARVPYAAEGAERVALRRAWGGLGARAVVRGLVVSPRAAGPAPAPVHPADVWRSSGPPPPRRSRPVGRCWRDRRAGRGRRRPAGVHLWSMRRPPGPGHRRLERRAWGPSPTCGRLGPAYPARPRGSCGGASRFAAGAS